MPSGNANRISIGELVATHENIEGELRGNLLICLVRRIENGVATLGRKCKKLSVLDVEIERRLEDCQYVAPYSPAANAVKLLA